MFTILGEVYDFESEILPGCLVNPSVDLSKSALADELKSLVPEPRQCAVLSFSI